MKTYIDTIQASPKVPDYDPEVILLIQARERIRRAIALMAARVEKEESELRG